MRFYYNLNVSIKLEEQPELQIRNLALSKLLGNTVPAWRLLWLHEEPWSAFTTILPLHFGADKAPSRDASPCLPLALSQLTHGRQSSLNASGASEMCRSAIYGLCYCCLQSIKGPLTLPLRLGLSSASYCRVHSLTRSRGSRPGHHTPSISNHSVFTSWFPSSPASLRLVSVRKLTDLNTYIHTHTSSWGWEKAHWNHPALTTSACVSYQVVLRSRHRPPLPRSLLFCRFCFKCGFSPRLTGKQASAVGFPLIAARPGFSPLWPSWGRRGCPAPGRCGSGLWRAGCGHRWGGRPPSGASLSHLRAHRQRGSECLSLLNVWEDHSESSMLRTSLIRHEILSHVFAVVEAAGQNHIVVVSLRKKKSTKPLKDRTV